MTFEGDTATGDITTGAAYGMAASLIEHTVGTLTLTMCEFKQLALKNVPLITYSGGTLAFAAYAAEDTDNGTPEVTPCIFNDIERRSGGGAVIEMECVGT